MHTLPQSNYLPAADSFDTGFTSAAMLPADSTETTITGGQAAAVVGGAMLVNVLLLGGLGYLIYRMVK